MPTDESSCRSSSAAAVISIISEIAFVSEKAMYQVLWFMTGKKIQAVEWLICQIEACAPSLRTQIKESFGEDGLRELDNEIESLRIKLEEVDRFYEGLNKLLNGGEMEERKSELCYCSLEKIKKRFGEKICIRKLPDRI